MQAERDHWLGAFAQSYFGYMSASKLLDRDHLAMFVRLRGSMGVILGSQKPIQVRVRKATHVHLGNHSHTVF